MHKLKTEDKLTWKFYPTCEINNSDKLQDTFQVLLQRDSKADTVTD